MIIGPGGAGKSTLANRLGQLLNIRVVHLDQLYWQSGWVEMPKPEWLETVKELVSRDAWIIDGNYSGTLEIRTAACDTIVFLDLPRLVCLWRVLKRFAIYRNRNRPDMAEGCRERLTREFLLWIWNYSRRTRPKVLRLMESHAGQKKMVWLRSKSEVERFLERPLAGE